MEPTLLTLKQIEIILSDVDEILQDPEVDVHKLSKDQLAIMKSFQNVFKNMLRDNLSIVKLVPIGFEDLRKAIKQSISDIYNKGPLYRKYNTSI